MACTLALWALLGVVGIVSAASYNNNNNAGNCSAKKYNVEGIVSDPYLSATDSYGKNSGFIIDFLELLKSSSNGTFDYKLTARSDGNYPALIDDIVSNKFDLVAADLVVQSDRQASVDFLQPYLQSQIRILTNNNPTDDANFQNAVVGYNPTWYIEDDVGVKFLLQNSENATLNAIYKSAAAANRIVDVATGAAAVAASKTPAALVGVRPGISNANSQSTATALTADILGSRFVAIALQQNQNAQRLCLNKLQLKVQENGSLQALLNKYNLSS